MRKFKLLTLLAAALFSANMWAGGSCGNGLTWDITGTTLTITYDGVGTGVMTDYGYDTPWNEDKAGITTIILPDGLTTISSNAFATFENVESITIPSSVTYIGDDAFFNCTSMAEVHISAPASIEWIDSWCDDFMTGDRVTRCYVPASELSDYITNYSTGCTAGDMDCDDVNVTFAAEPLVWTSGDCTVTLDGNEVRITGSGAMANYADAASQPWASSRSDIKSVVIKDGVTHIGNSAFDACSNLTSIESKPSTPPTLGTNAFRGYDASLKITGYPCVNYEDYVDAWNVFAEGKFCDCVRPADACGDGLTYETTGTYPNNKLVISKTFHGTGAMDDFASDSDRPWNAIAAYYIEVEIGDGITHIGDKAFKDFNKLQRLTSAPTTAPTLGTDAIVINNYNYQCQIIYPCGSYDSYTTTWSGVPNMISEECPTMAANADPADPGVYYSTFYHSSKKYELPSGVEAYVATVDGSDLVLTLLAEAGDVIPAGRAVILKSDHARIVLDESEASAVSPGISQLLGRDYAYGAPDNCYVLSGNDGIVGFYQWTKDKTIPAHKAFLTITPKASSTLPTRLRFVIGNKAPTSIGEVESDDVQTIKVIENGQFFIIKNGVRYNAQGQIVK